jgi:hypothetical protein
MPTSESDNMARALCHVRSDMKNKLVEKLKALNLSVREIRALGIILDSIHFNSFVNELILFNAESLNGIKYKEEIKSERRTRSQRS